MQTAVRTTVSLRQPAHVIKFPDDNDDDDEEAAFYVKRNGEASIRAKSSRAGHRDARVRARK